MTTHSYSCLEDSMDKEAWGATVHGGHEELDMTEHAQCLYSAPGDLFVCY